MFTKSENKLSFYDTAKKNGMIFPELERFLSKMEREDSPCSTRGYKDSLSRFVIHFNILSLSDIEKIDINQYMNFQDYLKDNGLKYTSVNSHILRIKSFVNQMIKRKLIKNRDIQDLESLKKNAKEKVIEKAIFTAEEELAMIENADTLQNKVMVIIMFETGMRRSEISAMKTEDYNSTTGKIFIRGKGNKDVYRSLRPEVCELVEKYLLERDTKSKFFFYNTKRKDNLGGITTNAVFDRIQLLGRLAGIPEEKLSNIGCHSLRRTFITKVVNQFGVPKGSKLARHSSWTVTQRYVIIDEDEVNEALLNQNAAYSKNKEN